MRSDERILYWDGSVDVEAGGRWELEGYDQAVGTLTGKGVVAGVQTDEGFGDPARIEVHPMDPGWENVTEIGVAFEGRLDVVIGGCGSKLLTNRSTHEGEFWINDGTVILGADDALSANAVIRLGGELQLDGTGQRWRD